MPNLRKNPSAEKRIRQADKARIRNRIVRGQMRRSIRVFKAEEDLAKREALLPGVFSSIDKAVKKNIIHKNTASRYKSRLAKMLKPLES